MAGQAVAISDLVVAGINAKSDYSNSYTPSATRRFLVNARLNREDITGLVCYVVPATLNGVTYESEQTYLDNYLIRIFVIDRVSKSNNSDDYDETQLTNLLTLVEEIQTQVIQYAETEANNLVMAGTYANNPLFDDEQLTNGVFLSATEFTFRHYRGV